MEKKTVGQKVKGHFKRNKDKYIAGATVVVVGGVCFYMGRKYQEGTTSVSMDVINNVHPTNVAIGKDIEIDASTKITNNVTNINMGGHMKKIVRRVSDGKLFGSVQEAANEAGVSQPIMSKHLNGKCEHIMGDQYEIVGLATS